MGVNSQAALGAKSYTLTLVKQNSSREIGSKLQNTWYDKCNVTWVGFTRKPTPSHPNQVIALVGQLYGHKQHEKRLLVDIG